MITSKTKTLKAALQLITFCWKFQLIKPANPIPVFPVFKPPPKTSMIVGAKIHTKKLHKNTVWK